MKKLLELAKVAITAMGMVGSAFATQTSITNNWTGIYAGANGGFDFNHVQLRSQQLGFTNPSDHCNSDSNYSSFFPGIEFGYMYQFVNDLVSGIELNFMFNTSQQDSLNCTCPFHTDVSDRFSFRNKMQSSIKGRIGRALNWNNNFFLPYLTAGVSFANVGLRYENEGGDYYSKNVTKAGWLIGTGIAWALNQQWSLRAEYYYGNYGNSIKLPIPSVYDLVDPDGNAHADLSTNNVVVAIDYWI